jgi:hypothetical protein
MTVYLLKDDSSIKFQHLECDFLFGVAMMAFSFELNCKRLEFVFSFGVEVATTPKGTLPPAPPWNPTET